MSDPTRPAPPARPATPAFKVLGAVTRMMMIIPVIAAGLTAFALLVYGAWETFVFIQGFYGGAEHVVARDQALLHAIEIVDLFLLATVVQVVSLGIYQLYFRQDLDLPRWLKIDDLDDLKSKLVGVTITVLAVYFLGRAITWEEGPSILYLGGGVAVMIAAMTYFLSTIDRHD